MEVSITCDRRTIRIDYLIKGGRVPRGNGLCRFQAPKTIEVRSDLTKLTGKAGEPLAMRE
jgi:hypothetical protein